MWPNNPLICAQGDIGRGDGLHALRPRRGRGAQVEAIVQLGARRLLKLHLWGNDVAHRLDRSAHRIYWWQITHQRLGRYRVDGPTRRIGR